MTAPRSFAATSVSRHPAYADHPAITRTDNPLDHMPATGQGGLGMIRIAELDKPPRRQLSLRAYALVHDALTQRLEDVEAQYDVRLTTDYEDFGNSVAGRESRASAWAGWGSHAGVRRDRGRVGRGVGGELRVVRTVRQGADRRGLVVRRTLLVRLGGASVVLAACWR